jgi:hypothetical protein
MTLSDIHLGFLRRAAESAVSADMDVAISPNILFALLDEIGLHRNLADLATKQSATTTCTIPSVPLCSIDGCQNRAYKTNLYCSVHIRRFQRHGDPNIVLKPGRKSRKETR